MNIPPSAVTRFLEDAEKKPSAAAPANARSKRSRAQAERPVVPAEDVGDMIEKFLKGR